MIRKTHPAQIDTFLREKSFYTKTEHFVIVIVSQTALLRCHEKPMIHEKSTDASRLISLIHAVSQNRQSLENSFYSFAVTAEHICEAMERPEKSRYIADYFETLTEDDLARAARYLAGQIFPVQDRRTLNVGPATIITAMSQLLGIHPQEIKACKMVAGDLGIAAYDLFEERRGNAKSESWLTLQDIAAALDQISATPGTKLKTARLKDLFRQATSLEVKFLVKMLVGDLRLCLRICTVEDAIARWMGTDLASIQRANLLTGDIGATAILAKNHQIEAACPRLFRPIKLTMAKAIDLSEAVAHLPERYFVEDQFEGIRVQVHLGLDFPEQKDAPGCVHQGIRVAIFSRTLADVTNDFQSLVPALSALLPENAGAVAANGLMIDGEIVRMCAGKILPPAASKMGPTSDPKTDRLDNQSHLAFVAYDLLLMDGRVLLHEPFVTRSLGLDELVYLSPWTWRLAARQFTDPRALMTELEAALSRGAEGILLKDPQAPYYPGRRSTAWLNVKKTVSTLDVVMTAAENGMGTSDEHLTNYTISVRASEDDPRLLEIGRTKLGSGDLQAARLAEWLRTHPLRQDSQDKGGRVILQIVLEVAFSKVKATRRYESGFILELPRIVRIRENKSVQEIDTLEAVRRLAVREGSFC